MSAYLIFEIIEWMSGVFNKRRRLILDPIG